MAINQFLEFLVRYQTSEKAFPVNPLHSVLLSKICFRVKRDERHLRKQRSCDPEMPRGLALRGFTLL